MTSTSISNTFLSFHPFFFWEKVVQKSNPQTIPTNQSTNRTNKKTHCQPTPAATHHDPPTGSIHSFQTKPVAPQLDVHEIRKMEKEAGRGRSCRVVMGGWLFFVTLHSKLTWQRKIHLFPIGNTSSNGGFSIAMLVCWRVMARPYSPWKDAALNWLVSQSIFFSKKGGEGYLGAGGVLGGFIGRSLILRVFLGRIFFFVAALQRCPMAMATSIFFSYPPRCLGKFREDQIWFPTHEKADLFNGLLQPRGKRWCFGDHSKPLDKKPTDTHGSFTQSWLQRQDFCWLDILKPDLFSAIGLLKSFPPLWFFDLYVCLLYAFCCFFQKWAKRSEVDAPKPSVPSALTFEESCFQAKKLAEQKEKARALFGTVEIHAAGFRNTCNLDLAKSCTPP